MTAAAPSGVVTFLFTDVEGSTRRWETDAEACGRRWPRMTRCCAPRLRRTAAFCSSTPVTVCVRHSRHRRQRSMPLWMGSESWSCRCGWGSRPVKPSCGTGITSVRCSIGLRG